MTLRVRTGPTGNAIGYSYGGGTVTATIYAQRRRMYERAELAPEQWARLGRLLVAAGGRPSRQVADVPPWLSALVNDVALTLLAWDRRPSTQEGQTWF